MKEINFNKITRAGRDIMGNEYEAIEDEAYGYTLIQNQNGELTCSCGRSLVQVDENTYKCSGGFPMYHYDQGEIIKDKFGNIYLKSKPHGGNNNVQEN